MVGGQREADQPVGVTCTFILSAFSIFSYPRGPETPVPSELGWAWPGGCPALEPSFRADPP